MRAVLLATFLATACGDNAVTMGPPISHADTVFFAAHTDDDMIFMQPQLVDALAAGEVATVYFSVGDEVKGYSEARDQLEAAKAAYAGETGGEQWDCGYVDLAVPVEHCKLVGHHVSLIAVDLPDGGIPGDRRDSLLHLVDGHVQALDLVSPAGGRATRSTVTELAADLLVELSPTHINALELAGTHGRDHSSHMFSAAFLLWAAARSGYAGELAWHRGYNVGNDSKTLGRQKYDRALHMLEYYEACSDGCARCGVPCDAAKLTPAHVSWIARQHAVDRVRESSGKLAFGNRCLRGTFELGDCSGAPMFTLTSDGQLRYDGSCVTASDDEVTTAACDGRPSQYWVLDSEGSLWNGEPPRPAGDMSYDHVRCLAASENGLAVRNCGKHATFSWRFTP